MYVCELVVNTVGNVTMILYQSSSPGEMFTGGLHGVKGLVITTNL